MKAKNTADVINDLHDAYNTSIASKISSALFLDFHSIFNKINLIARL
jgi:hypothetical protein